MQLPCIHLNGTSKKRLIDDLCEVSSRLESALEALRRASPNGRDYYPFGPDALRAAEAEHLDRFRRLVAVKEEIDALTCAIDAIE